MSQAAEEVEALRAIYDADFRTISEERRMFSVTIQPGTEGNTPLSLELLLTFPEGYPNTSPPEYELKNAPWLDSSCVLCIADNLSRIYSENLGEVVVYQWIEWIKDYITSKAEELQEAMTQATEERSSPGSGKNSDYGSPGSGSEDNEAALSPRTLPHEERQLQPVCPAILHGEPLTDRKSTFQAHVAMVTTVQESHTQACIQSGYEATSFHSLAASYPGLHTVWVRGYLLLQPRTQASLTPGRMLQAIKPCRMEVEAVMTELKSTRKIATATHNILAYRLYDESRGVFQQDCDDDGEAAAGGRLLHLLQIMDVRNAMVVVTRWFGGILLHADRFKHINNVARILLQESGVGQKHKEEAVMMKKKQKKPGRSKGHHR